MPSAAVRSLSWRIGRRMQPTAVPWVIVPDARAAMASLAAEFYGHPSRSMQVVGITGHERQDDHRVFITRRVRIGRKKVRASRHRRPTRLATRSCLPSRTTPEAPDVQRMFRQMVDAGCAACVMEVSSHALALRRVDDTAFAAACSRI